MTPQKQTAPATTTVEIVEDRKNTDELVEELIGLKTSHQLTPKSPDKCPVFCCFYAEFDIKTGPVVRYQSPENFMAREINTSTAEIHGILKKTFETFKCKQKSDENKHTDNGELDSSSSFVDLMGKTPSTNNIVSSDESPLPLKNKDGAKTETMGPKDGNDDIRKEYGVGKHSPRGVNRFSIPHRSTLLLDQSLRGKLSLSRHTMYML